MLIQNCWYKNTCKAECNEGCIRFIEMSFLMTSSLLPKNKQKPISLICSKGDSKSFKILNELDMLHFVQEQKNLYLCSENVGNGKTSWGIKLLHRYMNKIWLGNGLKRRVLFVHLPTLLTKLKNFQQEYSNLKHYIETVDLILWDEVGIPLSEYDRNILLSLIEYRVNDGKSNIFTSNKTTLEDLSEAVGERLASRIMGLSKILEFVGADKRGKVEND